MPVSHLELSRRIEVSELRLRVHSLLHRPQELLLEAVDLLYVSEECAELCRGQEGLLLQRLQVGLHQVSQVPHVGVFGVQQLADHFPHLLGVGQNPGRLCPGAGRAILVGRTSHQECVDV